MPTNAYSALQSHLKCISLIGCGLGQVGPLFDLLDAFTMRTRVDFAFLQHYLKTTIAETYSLQARRQARSEARSCLDWIQAAACDFNLHLHKILQCEHLQI